ncbi:LpqN/LpqT family lipoprotein [Rhodococcus sp. HNM0569]|uniref:LpqN/LpqT family lipoprotein n=1 Tax=Rhodococcus sp. HNM0569 TaxID=2716340 RepID=UPI00146B6CA2|nr:hypothetical protein [Rhodococcus sp. HNM0569]
MSSPLLDYLDNCGAHCTPCAPGSPFAPAVSIPELPGWTVVPRELVPGAYSALTNPSYRSQGWAPNAVVLHGRISKEISAEGLLDAACTEPAALPKWTEHLAAREPWNGHPSLFVEGTYEVENLSLFATTRYVIVDTAAGQFLTQLTVTVATTTLDDLHVDVVTFNSALSIAAG